MPVTDEVAQDGRMLPVKIIPRNLGGFVVALTPDFCNFRRIVFGGIDH